ncbi:MAG: zinc-dependent alcohol dehydrogenase [Microbacterium sp.]
MIGVTKVRSGPGNVALAERPQRDPAPGEVRLEVLGAGVCGTDLHIEADEFRSAPPVTMGHEVCGTVVAHGDGVDPAWLGIRVVSETYFSTCCICAWCRDGRPNLCPERRSIGSFADGAFAPFVVVPARNLHPVPPWLGDHAASLAEPLACVCHCLCDPGVVAAGDRVVVTGPGPVGLLAAQVARAHGAAVTVVGLPSDTARLDAAERLGFSTATTVEPESATVVIECSGAAGGARTALEAAGRGARYVQIGVFGKDIEAPLDRIFQKELVVSSGFASTPRSWRRAMTLIEDRSIELELLVSEVVPLDAWERVFADLRAGRGIKVVFDPRLGAAGPHSTNEREAA